MSRSHIRFLTSSPPASAAATTHCTLGPYVLLRRELARDATIHVPAAGGRRKNADFWGLTEIEAGSPISLPATEIGWLAPGRRFLRQDYVL